jgi:hypothetical protein
MTADLVRYARDIEDAREKVAKAQLEYSRGGSLDKLNLANRKLADCHAAYRECTGGKPHDPR